MLLIAAVVLYNVQTRRLHRHAVLVNREEWLLWTAICVFGLLLVEAIFQFYFFFVVITLVVGLRHVRLDRASSASRRSSRRTTSSCAGRASSASRATSTPRPRSACARRTRTQAPPPLTPTGHRASGEPAMEIRRFGPGTAGRRGRPARRAWPASVDLERRRTPSSASSPSPAAASSPRTRTRTRRSSSSSAAAAWSRSATSGADQPRRGRRLAAGRAPRRVHRRRRDARHRGRAEGHWRRGRPVIEGRAEPFGGAGATQRTASPATAPPWDTTAPAAAAAAEPATGPSGDGSGEGAQPIPAVEPARGGLAERRVTRSDYDATEGEPW